MDIVKMRKKLVSLSSLAVLAMASAASAAPVKDVTGALFVDGLTPNGRVIVEYPNAQKVVNGNADACGRLIIRNSAANKLDTVTSVLINGATVNAPTDTNTIPRCLNGVEEVERTANYKTPAGDFVIVGQSPLSQNAIAFPGVTLSRQVNVNACGFIRLTTSPQYPLTGTIKVNGVDIDASGTPVDDPPLCRNNVLYLPE